MPDERPEVATKIDAPAYHGPLAAAFRERGRIPEQPESDFDPEPSGETIEYVEWKRAVLDQENADVQ